MAVLRRRRPLKIKKDLKSAQRIADQFGLIPTLDRVDASRPGDVSSLISDRQGLYDKTLTRDPEQQNLLSLLKGGLGGLTSQENTAFRERGEVGLDRTFTQGQRAMASNSAARGVRGAASTAGLRDLIVDRGAAQGALERDLQLENINIQDKRRTGFGDFLDKLVTGEFDRSNTALTGLEGALNTARNDELNRTLLNMDAQRREEALKNSTLFGLVGIKGNRRSGADALELEKARLELDKQIAAQQREEFSALLGKLGGASE